MRRVDELRSRVRAIETVWIRLSDGTALAARLWLPHGAENDPVPTVLEYLPYRRRDFTRRRDEQMMPYLAAHGYACLRVDMRGSGDSDGVLRDEYLPQEQDDALEILRWVEEQPWSDGKVGIIGISWGGFNGLQIAARRPPQLGAIISLCSTDDRYRDDVHYMGGCLLGDNLSWASVMFAYNACPPDPEVVGERWRELWFRRIDESGLWLESWMSHPRRDAYWRHGSVCERYADIEVPVMLASGWADGYSNAIFRLLAGLKVPTRALIGPWSHIYPHLGRPGPAIGFLQEVVRWFDHWLKGIDRGVEYDPVLRVWMQDSVPPHPNYQTRPGRWVSESQWPSSDIREWRLALSTPSGLESAESSKQPTDDTLWVQSPLSVGLFAGKWCSYAAPPDLPHDQRSEDGGALWFETAPLESPVELLGAPVLDLAVSVNRPVAMVAARLSDVAPDGEATRITYGLLNLTHRNGHARPEPLMPGRRYQVRVKLNDIAQRFPRGHRIRLSLSTSYFPLAWPPPSPVTLHLHTGTSTLTLPVRPPRASDTQLRRLGEPEATSPPPTTVLEPAEHRWRVITDLAEDSYTLEVLKNEGLIRLEDTGMVFGDRTREWYSHTRKDYRSLRGEVQSTRRFQRDDWRIRIEARTVLTSDDRNFYIHATLDAYEGDERVRSLDWHSTLPRDHV